MYFAIVYMDFYFNISMDSTYVRKYYTLVCFHPKVLKSFANFSIRSFNFL
jgi:hypothetical protein